MKKTIEIFVFDDVEVLDFTGPFEVFSVANELENYRLFDICITSISQDKIRARNGLNVIVDRLLDSDMVPDILILPGGNGTRAILSDKKLLEHVDKCHKKGSLIFSICSGALIVASAGLLASKNATTHHEVAEELSLLEPTCNVSTDKRWIDHEDLVVSAGISAGIDASLHILATRFGAELRRKVARYMEYRDA